MSHQSNAIEEAKKAGFDMSLVEANLALSHEERARRHDEALALILELEKIRRHSQLRMILARRKKPKAASR